MWGHILTCECAVCHSFPRIFELLKSGSKYSGFVARAGEKVRLLEGELRDLLSQADGSREVAPSAGLLAAGELFAPRSAPKAPLLPSGLSLPGGVLPAPPLAEVGGLFAKAKPAEKQGEGGEENLEVKSEGADEEKEPLEDAREAREVDKRRKEKKKDKKEKHRSRSRRRRRADSKEVEEEESRKEARVSEDRKSRRESPKRGDPTSPRKKSDERGERKKGESKSPRGSQRERSREGARGWRDRSRSRRSRGPRPPDHPPPTRPRVPQGPGWRGPIPYSSHPRWFVGKNRGITKRAKQEIFNRRKEDQWRQRQR